MPSFFYSSSHRRNKPPFKHVGLLLCATRALPAGISVVTKMLHIDFTILHQKVFEKNPPTPNPKSRNNPQDIREACETGRRPTMATQPFSPRQSLFVVGARFLKLMPPLKSYSALHRNLIFLITFPCLSATWAQNLPMPRLVQTKMKQKLLLGGFFPTTSHFHSG